jgi:DNA helicase-2/ATP-dependent DNA helicase PcrA
MYRRNAEQDRLTDLPIVNVLAIAPAGCGKTEALARRAAAVLKRREIVAPRTILALTFSNKARDNLAARMRHVVGSSWRQRIVVTNFHGLAARVVRAHGKTIGLNPELILPEEPWLRRLRRSLGIDFNNDGAFDAALKSSKHGAFSDSEVMERLEASENDAAVQYEETLRENGRIDYDDLIRHAACILKNDLVSSLYLQHFGMVMVDEVQDLSLMQYELVRNIGGDRVTYAGDPAQGIYSFAGADPDGVMRRINSLSPEIVEFSTSYRSTPAVLSSVNVLANEMESSALTCGCPENWSDNGRVVYLERRNTDDEASALLQIVKDILSTRPDATIGVVGRRGTRMNQLKRDATAAGVRFEDWNRATHQPRIVELLKAHLREAANHSGGPEETLSRLELLCRQSLESTDAATMDELACAIDELTDAASTGTSVNQLVENCRRSPAPDAPVAPGLHFLTAHRGKGQEFDWVILVGMEDGHIPDFRSPADPEELRVLHVMVSRARYGLIFSYSRHTQNRAGWRKSTPSPWLSLLRSTSTESDIL